MTKIKNRTIDPSYEIHLGLYQALTGPDEEDKIYRSVSRDFFDLIVIDECHRGSAAEDSAWREILITFQRDPNRPDSNTKRNKIRFQYHLLWRTRLHLQTQAGD